ncbi:MAG: hypothetical protein KDM64_02070 [Verrucomicrobiae bacterium]|nr:hypothetical protein [Verrucomicrobiae bacterium]
MKRLPIILLSLLSALSASAQEVSPVEAKLRDTLKNTMLQLRNVEAERARLDAELQAVKAQSDKKIKDLTTQLDTAVKRGADEKNLADKIISEQKKNLATKDQQLDTLQTLLEKWKIAYVQISDIAQAKETERSKFEIKSIELKRKVDAREQQNVELYQLGKEIIERYENFALGRALLAREPFTGLTKVRLEEQIQDYKDKVDDRLGDPSESSSGAAPPSEPAPAPIEPETSGDLPPAP